MNFMGELDCLVLAAGSASRFGGCKLLVDWNGLPLIATSIAAARSVSPARIVIVGGAFYTQLIQAQSVWNNKSPPAELIEYRNWQQGMGHSLAFGVEHLSDPVSHDNPVLVLLGDQPLISAQDVQDLYRIWCENPTSIVCAGFAGTQGVPAIFPASFKSQLLASSGDRGAKAVIMKNTEKCIVVPMPSAEFDVDTAIDLQELLLKKITH